MPDPSAPAPLSEIDEVAERASFVSARRYVGAAGFTQRDVLEQIITAGKEQLVFTQSLRQVVASTLAQLSATPVGKRPEDAQKHLTALQDIVASARRQIETASQLRQTIQATLAKVRSTPLEDVSGHLLMTLSEAVQQQVSDLQAIIGVAIHEGGTAEQIASLEQVSKETSRQLFEVQHARVEQELVELSRLGDKALENVRSLEAEGQTHEAQRTTLVEEQQTAQRQIERLEAASVNDQKEIDELEQQRDDSQARLASLQAAAMEMQEKTQHLASLLDIQQQQEQAFQQANDEGTS